MTDVDFKGIDDGHSDFDLSFGGRIDDARFYDFNPQHLDDEIGITSGFAPAHRSDQVACEAAGLGDAARFAPHFCDCLQDSSRPVAMQAEAASEG
eukprot:COSAG03_NODE_2096_length_3132_cov_3.405138_5_plen_95_part_00